MLQNVELILTLFLVFYILILLFDFTTIILNKISKYLNKRRRKHLLNIINMHNKHLIIGVLSNIKYLYILNDLIDEKYKINKKISVADYLNNNKDIINKLSKYYYRKGDLARSYYSYTLSKIDLPKKSEDFIFHMLTTKSVYCVENSLKVLYNTGNVDLVIKAYEILSKTTVLQPICGRICPHEKQCQGNCIRGIKGEPVQIGRLEAFIGDMAIEEKWKIKSDIYSGDGPRSSLILTKSTYGVQNNDEDTKKMKKVAVVGSGPAGLTCAAFIARKGYSVTIYEKHEKLGGLLRHGIPDFRLDREVLDAQINKILELGINVVYDKKLGKDFDLNYLRSNYDAIFLGFGANISRKMNANK